MAINKPQLPPRPGYVEVEENGVRVYKPISVHVSRDSDVDTLAAAYKEGVNEA